MLVGSENRVLAFQFAIKKWGQLT